MNLRADITSRRLLHFKGWLFLVLGCISAGLLLFEVFTWQRLLLLGVAIWAFCRFYYFLFYVLEQYAGRERRYAGLLDALKYLLRGDRAK